MSKGPMHALARFIRKVAFADAVGVSDAQLLRAYAAHGDEDAFAALVKRHGPMVLGVCSRLLRNASDAEDAFQATFLVLARKAWRIVRPNLLANWLYGVARRTALEARAKAARRQRHEREAAAMRDHDSAGADTAAASLWSDLRPILDEEIAHLPERFRVPVILCYLEGRTNEEAARIIGCPKGTVLSRLATARERLRKRLTRRGVAPPAAMLTAALTSSALRAGVSPALVQTSVHAALAFAAGTPPASLAATILAKGVIANMFWTRTLYAVVLASALVLAGGAGIWVWAEASAHRGDSQPIVGAAPDVGAARGSKRSPEVGANAALPNGRGFDEQDLGNGQDKQLEAPRPQAEQKKDAKSDVKTVDVVEVKEQMVTDYAYYNGRAEAAVSVDLRARVSGYLVKVNVKEGAEVKKGDVLFEIDPRVYEAEAQRADALVAQADARMQRVEADFKRAEALRSKGAVSLEEFEKIKGDRTDAQSAVRVAVAGREIARLNLSFTKITAPIDGSVCRLPLSEGALVKTDETVLGSILSRNPVTVIFDMDERTVVQLRRRFASSEHKTEGWNQSVAMSLAGENDFSRTGKIESVDNRVDPKTGTLRVRAVFSNADGLILPGMSCKVRLKMGEPRKALMVPRVAVIFGGLIGETANPRNRERKRVFVVDNVNRIHLRDIDLGDYVDNNVVVIGGLKAGDLIVLHPHQSWIDPGGEGTVLQDGMTINPRLEPA